MKRNSDAPFGRREAAVVLLLLLLTFGIRYYVASRVACVSPDGASYLTFADMLRQGKFDEVFGHREHPFFTVVLFLTQEQFGNGIFVAQMLNVVLGTLALLPLYLLMRDIFGPKVAGVSGIFYACHAEFARMSASIHQEPLYLLFFVTAMWLGWRALKSRDRFLFAMAGLASGAAFLTRPEGLGAAIIICGWAVLLGLRHPLREGPKMLAAVVLVLFMAFVVAAPYLLEVRRQKGAWRLTAKHKVTEGLSMKPPMSPVQPKRYYVGAVREVAKRLVDACHWFSLLPMLMVIGLAAGGRAGGKERRDWFGEMYIFLAALLYLSVGYMKAVVWQHFSSRHIVSAGILLLPWMGAGFFVVSGWASRLIGGGRERASACLVLAVVLGIMLPKTLTELRTAKAWIPEVAAWLRENMPDCEKIGAFHERRLAFYSGKEYVELWLIAPGRVKPTPEQVYGWVVKQSGREQLGVIVVDAGKDKEHVPMFLSQVKPSDFELVKSFPKSKDSNIMEVHVYKVLCKNRQVP